MGNCYALCKPSMGLYVKLAAAKHGRVLQVVKMDGKILEFSTPILVKDMMVNFSGSGIGLSKDASENLPPNYELKIGKTYYMLPSLSSGSPTSTTAEISSIADKDKANGVKRIKIVITKQQLQELLTKQISVEDFMSGLEKPTSVSHVDSSTNWKPKLESIPEGSE
ncbi:uncharacterized protein LOC121257069 [Juglans microcarpa x Juglans regia]|uniref:uncharacterized protein LOC121257069 n=1 Tax=Juglans microcarpa x Juglans regia TaxID=2249226 RepID=UPI001B7E8C1A|nr:uncharacterized protein LOC121257069 [Juglans microcarpa x Juglans regia]